MTHHDADDPNLRATPNAADLDDVPEPGWSVSRLMVVVGAGLIFLSALLFFAFDLATVVRDAGLFMLAPATAIGLVVWRARPWSMLTGGILVAFVPLMVLGLFGAWVGLTDPTMGYDALGAAVLLLGLVLGLWGGIQGFVTARRRAPSAPLRTAWRTGQGAGALAAVALVAGYLVAAMFASAAARDAAASNGGYDFEAEDRVVAAAEDYEFTPAALNVAAGRITEVAFENRDPSLHTFTYTKDGKEYNHDVVGGASTSFLVLFDTPGVYQYWCKPHSEKDGAGVYEGMVGTIVVT